MQLFPEKKNSSFFPLFPMQYLQTGLIYEDNRVSHDKSSVEEDISCCVTMTTWKFTPQKQCEAPTLLQYRMPRVRKFKMSIRYPIIKSFESRVISNVL